MITWPTVPLGELCQIELGGTPPRGSPRFWDEERTTRNVWLSIADLPMTVNAIVSDSKEYLSDAGAARGKIVKAGTLLVSFKLTLGRLAFAGCDLRTNEAIAALSIHDAKRISKEYLYWFLTYFDWDKAAEGEDKVKGKTLNKAKLKELPVLIPPIEEQRRIVAVLDESFAAIATATANTEKNLANARELFERYLAETFSRNEADWIEEPLNAHVRFVDYRGKTPPKRDAGIRLITAKNVKMGFVQRHPEEFVDPAAYDSWMTRGLPNPGDVLFTTEAPLGNVAQLDTDEKVMIGQRLITMQPDPKRLDSSFLKYALCSAPVQKLIHQKATGATVSGIKAKLLKLIPIRYPSLVEQSQIVGKLDEIYSYSQALAEQSRDKLAALAALKQSLLNRAFAGELTAPMPETIAA